MSRFPYVSEEDRRHIENKYHLTDQPFDGFKRMAYHGYAYDESTGRIIGLAIRNDTKKCRAFVWQP
jgi:hypothetical protein